eukprot:7950472-Lingulodinium_polyedra.AAC.1
MIDAMPADTHAAQLQQVRLKTRNGTTRDRTPPGPPPPEERGARVLHAGPRKVPTDGAGCN